MYEVLLHPDAEEVYAKADRSLARKIARCLQQLEQNPRFHPNIKALKSDYSVEDELVRVFVVAPLASMAVWGFS